MLTQQQSQYRINNVIKCISCMLSGIVLLISCAQSNRPVKQEKSADTISNSSVVSYSQLSDSIGKLNSDANAETAVDTFFIVQVAEGEDFEQLKAISEQAAIQLGSRVDMLGREYKINKGIIVPENSEDDIYRGEYYPRRPFDDQNFISIEMSGEYLINEPDTLKMLIVANIFKIKNQADSVVRVLQSNFKNAKTVKTELFLGCMH